MKTTIMEAEEERGRERYKAVPLRGEQAVKLAIRTIVEADLLKRDSMTGFWDQLQESLSKDVSSGWTPILYGGDHLD